MIAAVHVRPVISIPIAIAFVGLIVWYWLRLGRTAGLGRRRIRRVSLLLMLVALPNLVRGLSLLDPAQHGRAYLLSWTLTLGMVVLVLMTAMADALFTLHVEKRALHREVTEAGAALADTLAKQQRTNDET